MCRGTARAVTRARRLHHSVAARREQHHGPYPVPRPEINSPASRPPDATSRGTNEARLCGCDGCAALAGPLRGSSCRPPAAACLRRPGSSSFVVVLISTRQPCTTAHKSRHSERKATSSSPCCGGPRDCATPLVAGLALVLEFGALREARWPLGRCLLLAPSCLAVGRPWWAMALPRGWQDHNAPPPHLHGGIPLVFFSAGRHGKPF